MWHLHPGYCGRTLKCQNFFDSFFSIKKNSNNFKDPITMKAKRIHSQCQLSKRSRRLVIRIQIICNNFNSWKQIIQMCDLIWCSEENLSHGEVETAFLQSGWTRAWTWVFWIQVQGPSHSTTLSPWNGRRTPINELILWNRLYQSVLECCRCLLLDVTSNPWQATCRPIVAA